MQQAQQIEVTESSSRVDLVAVPPDGVRNLWPLAEPLLAKATDLSTKLDTDDILQQCEIKDMQLWLAVDADNVYAAIVTDMLTYISGWKVVRVLACGGSRLFKWRLAVDERITAFARLEGCDAVEIIGMDFWENVFPGFEKIETVFSKELRDG